MRIAAIDIGTNSVRSVIVDVPVGGPRTTLDDEKAYTRLGRHLAATGTLAPEAIDDTVDALGRMLEIARPFDVTHTRVIATAAMRTAANAEELIDRARSDLGIEIEVVSEEEEGRLAFLSAAESAHLTGRTAVVDIGGGSVEVVRSVAQEIDRIVSLPLGAVVLSERYHTEDPIPPREFKRLTKHVRRALRGELGSSPDPVLTLVGSGGTVTTVAAVIAARLHPTLASLHGYEVKRVDVAHLVAELARSSADERRRIKGLPEARVDIIVAGTVVLDELMRLLGANAVWVNTNGIRAGLVIDTIARERGEAHATDRMDAVRAFGRTCHNDTKHAEQVRELSLTLFDELAEELALDPASRPLLEAAALLHDVGYHIAYEKHHKHSFHLISHARLPGFGSKERRSIAGIARYHRGSLPKNRHEAMQDLSPDERKVVQRLGSLLRIADGLDRARAQRITGLAVRGDGARLELTILGTGPLDVELHGARRKADMFEHVFERRLDIEARETEGAFAR